MNTNQLIWIATAGIAILALINKKAPITTPAVPNILPTVPPIAKPKISYPVQIPQSALIPPSTTAPVPAPTVTITPTVPVNTTQTPPGTLSPLILKQELLSRTRILA
jgi:hypothetical protein